MSKYSNYRIVEKGNYYIQRKTIIGWIYSYNWEKTAWFLLAYSALFAVFTISFIVMLFAKVHIPSVLYIIDASLPILFVCTLILYKEEYGCYDDAKSDINSRISKAEMRKQKSEDRKLILKEKRSLTKKIHYLDLETERKYKLKKLK